MKIVEETPTRLRLQHLPIRRWLFGGSFFIGCLGFLIYCLFFDFATARLTCERPLPSEMNCELRQFSLLGRKQRLRIFDIQNAYVKTTRQSRSTHYHVVILTSVGERDLISGQSYGKNQQDSQLINNYINSGQRFLLLEQNQRQSMLFKNLCLLIGMAIGAFELTAPVSNCIFYKSLNQVFIERKSLRVQKIIEEPLEKILRLEIQDKQFKYGRQYRAVIVLQSYEEIPINPEYTDEKNVYSTVARIKSFLGYF
ncbi:MULTISPECIES: hypothetical protein [unclassified Nodularia (in: cyanobacteria)]|uniref:hypothetical protein n=1 Tax=unclassified Nodularia (in: cyanobacteria) TaxID=2656917 RepID=UPI001D122A90|nr:MULTISPECIES: hypothetical protein [unclassified Nodularia (in: cyanobacteria)]